MPSCLLVQWSSSEDTHLVLTTTVVCSRVSRLCSQVSWCHQASSTYQEIVKGLYAETIIAKIKHCSKPLDALKPLSILSLKFHNSPPKGHLLKFHSDWETKAGGGMNRPVTQSLRRCEVSLLQISSGMYSQLLCSSNELKGKSRKPSFTLWWVSYFSLQREGWTQKNCISLKKNKVTFPFTWVCSWDTATHRINRKLFPGW